jgi:L-ornithine N5-oxygenase
VRDERGEVALDRCYAVKMRGDIGGRVYLQGSSERLHGLTATLLSALPIRSQEIMQDIIEHRAASGLSHESQGVHCVG